ncbi:hypothetical protein LCGC14_1333100 [marine sediment metagenome]|uniref:Uncharacterized protein n=1 Tax=marine sediment metagenome TaxID=412755 RepID=A0A0F9MWT7_9ZZZZ
MSEATALHVWGRRGVGWEVHKEHNGGCDERGVINAGWRETFTEEDARRIALTWGSHDSLVAACELASEQEECVCGGKGECLGCILQAALREAQR